MVIGARAEGRAKAVEEQAIHEDADAKTKVLIKAYKAFIDNYDNRRTHFDKWLGSINSSDFR